MGKLDSLVNDGSDRRRIIVKQLPERKSEDGAFDGRKGPERVPGGDFLEAAIEIVAGVENPPEHLPPEAGGPFAGHLAILAGDIPQAAIVGVFGARVRRSRLRRGPRRRGNACATQDVVGHAITMPPSTWMHWPVM